MLSILIPTYNYDVTNLVSQLYNQCIEVPNLSFEIIVYEDGSTNIDIIQLNKKIANIRYLYNEDNIGRTAARNFLAKSALFDTLLFLDADTLPKKSNFIDKYLTTFAKVKVPTAIFGGYYYQTTSYKVENSLRYYYGKIREESSAENRNKNAYAYVFSGNFMINKNDFLSLNIPSTNIYGMDNYISYLLKKNKIDVYHIENEIIHLGLEKNIDFYNKSITSIKFRKENMLDCHEIISSNALLKTYRKLNFFPINLILKISYSIFGNTLKKMFFKPKPNLKAFDIYRLLYLFNLK